MSIDWRSQPTSIPALWREIEKLQAMKISQNDRRQVWFLARALAEISGQRPDTVYRRIMPRNEYDLQAVHDLHDKCQNLSVQNMVSEPFFCEVFMNFKPTAYQFEFLPSEDRQLSVLWSRQSGKTTTIGLKLFKFCVRHPGSQATVTALGLRQSKIVIEKLTDVLYKMHPVAYRAWVEKPLKTIIRLHNRSRVKAFPFSLEKLRGETSDVVDIEEAGFIKECEELVQGTLTPQMATRWDKGAQIILNSTPWGRGFYWKTQYDPKLAPLWRQFRATWQDAVAAGLISQEFIDLQKQQLDPDRFAREYECKFTEDQGRWLSQDLITSCVDSSIVEPWRFEDTYHGLEFYMGLDVGQEQDYAVLAAIEKVGEVRFLRYCHVFPLGTRYDVLASHVKVLSDRWQETVRVFVDATNERALAETMKLQILGCEGVALSLQAKQRYAGFLKQLMAKRHFRFYFDEEVISGLAVEQFEMLEGKSDEGEGNIRFFHAPGTHDDVFWAIALACAASRSEPSGRLERAY